MFLFRTLGMTRGAMAMTMFIQSLPIFEVDVDLNDQSIRGSLLGTGIDPMLKRAITVWCIFWEFTMGSSFNNASIDVCSWSNGSTRCRCTLDTGGSLGSAQECLRCTTSHGVLPTLSLFSFPKTFRKHSSHA